MTVRELDRAPDLKLLYGKAVVTSLRGGVGPGGDGGHDLPDDELVLSDVEVDRDHLVRYSRVCGFRLTDALPPTYLHIVGFPLSVKLMSEPGFPFALPGLVHVANRIEHRRPVMLDERPTVRVRMSDLQPHPSGQRFDVVTEATVDGEEVWREVSTYLHKGDGSEDGERVVVDAPDRAPEAAIWHVPREVGRRYAAVSGDPNPIHLHQIPAKLFGFPSNIAHGMWTKARALAALEGRLPDAFEVTTTFDKPLILPRDVAFTAVRRDEGWAIAVHDAKRDEGGTPQLAGEIAPLT